jgi:serine/threonine-protein kinase
LTEKYPLDAEFYFHLGLAEVEQFALMDISALKKAVEIDPGFARAWWQLGQGEAYAGRFDAARVALDKCLDVSHAATSCLWNRICLSELEGRCEEVERDARQWTAIDGTDPLGRYAVAGALHARGRSLEAVAEALRQKESVETPADAPRSKLEDEILLALVRGDFTHALHAARSLEKLVESAQAETEHEFAAHAMIDALMESGQTSEAGAYAAHYAKRREAWLPAAIPEDFAVADDVVPLTLVARRAAKLVSSAEYLTQLDAWMSEWQRRLQKGAHGYVWLHGLAATAETPEDARLALARLGNMPIPPYTPKTLVSAGLGRAYLLAGRLDDAMPLLERASKSCMSLAKPVTHTRSHLWLGQAREAKHDVAGACAAYGAVIDRWGNARPRSVTADEARARQRALGCK